MPNLKNFDLFIKNEMKTQHQNQSMTTKEGLYMAFNILKVRALSECRGFACKFQNLLQNRPDAANNIKPRFDFYPH